MLGVKCGRILLLMALFFDLLFFFGRIYQKWSAKPYRLFHTLDVPSLHSALLLLYCSS